MRIYIDSRYRTPDSASASDFTIELNESFELPINTKVRLHDISIPYSWRTVEENLNQELYLEERTGAPNQWVRRVLKLTPGQYDGRSLATALQTLFNTGSAWSLAYNGGLEAPYTISYSEQTGSVRISLANAAVGSAVLWSDSAIGTQPQSAWAGADVLQPRSFNRNLRIATNVTIGAGTTPWTSQFVDLITIKACYVHSNSLGNLSNVGPRPGDRSCLCKVAVTSSYGYLLHSDGSSWEFAECNPGQLLKRLSFTLQDATGAIVPLHGCDWSFALTFNDPLTSG